MPKNGENSLCVAGHRVLKETYVLYRTLGYTLLADDFWHRNYLVLGVALSKSGLFLFVEKELPGLLDKMQALAILDSKTSEKVVVRAIGPLSTSAHGGDSTGAGTGRRESGTFGCLVADAHIPKYGITCDHVVGTLAGQTIGDAVWAPGSARGGTSKSRIGKFGRGSTVILSTQSSNRVDGALIELNTPSAHLPSINGIPGAPSGVNRALSLGDALKKSGASTGVTTGEYQYLTTFNVPYPAGQARFVDQIGIDGGGIVFADRGDSGAVVLDDSNKVAGLLFCSASQSYLGFANPIADVESELGVTVI
jgi:hypothetical protein